MKHMRWAGRLNTRSQLSHEQQAVGYRYVRSSEYENIFSVCRSLTFLSCFTGMIKVSLVLTKEAGREASHNLVCLKEAN